VGNVLSSCDGYMAAFNRWFFILQTFRSLSAIVAQPKNCQFGFNNKTELKNITTTTDNNGTYQVMFQLTNMPAMSEVVVTFVAQS